MENHSEYVFLRRLFAAATTAADPARCVPQVLATLPFDVSKPLLVLGAGKASAAMAQAVEAHWPGTLEGLVVTRYGFAVPCQRIEIVEAAHPVPDAAGQAATARIMERMAAQGAGDQLPGGQVLFLLSGGASALLVAPAPSISLREKQEVTQALLRSGATIHEMNCVRKHLSAVKGGRLARAAGAARLVTLAISDVAGDDPQIIGSGPTVEDASSCADALEIVDRYGIVLPPALRDRLLNGELETPKPGNRERVSDDFRIIASPSMALRAAAEVARAAGIAPLILGDEIEGEACEVARVLAGIAKGCASHGLPLRPPCVLLSGGETTISLRGKGRGGRNSELMLALAIALQGHSRIHALAGDTDGIDGSEDNAGALIEPQTLGRARQLGIEPRRLLDDNDAWSFFAALGDLLLTGPTRTNVNDFHAILIH